MQQPEGTQGRLSGRQTLTAPVIYGCAGTELLVDERRFFGDLKPLGFILFARNCETPAQIRSLTDDFRQVSGQENPLILIDQEGGRVARLKPPHFRAAPPARAFGELAAVDKERAREAARLNARLIAAELGTLGINVDCLPVLDVPTSDGHDIIGDRAYCADPGLIAEIGRATADGLLAGGVLPVAKHIPGHGRAQSDSHLSLPVVDTSEAELSRIDFAPFRALNDLPLAMTAHVVYSAIDSGAPATTSATVIEKIIRGDIGFDGLLMSDDVSMEALDGPVGGRAGAALGAGCDVVLHCNGDMGEMIDIAENLKPLTKDAERRAQNAFDALRPADDFDTTAGLDRLEHLFSQA